MMTHREKVKLARKMLTTQERKQAKSKHAKYNTPLFGSMAWGQRHGQIQRSAKKRAERQHHDAQRRKVVKKATMLGIAHTDF